MSELSRTTTSNGHEIEHPREKLTFNELKEMLSQYGLEGSTPAERADAIRKTTADKMALFMTDVNKRSQGSDDTLVHDETMKIGDDELIAPEERYDLFNTIFETIKNSPEDTNPERIGDALALTTVLLHPFKDGNGRTSRMLGFMLRDDFDEPDAAESFDQLVAPRDIARAEGGFLINGYIPYVGEGADQSNPATVEKYIQSVLTSNDNLYTGPYGQAELTAVPKVPEMSR